MALIFTAITCVQFFDLNALAGLLYEPNGPEQTGMATFTFMTGMSLGSVFGNQLFTLLSSDFLFRKVFGVETGAVISHRGLNLFSALTTSTQN